MRYEGAWRRGRRQGQGTEWYPSGEEYTGAVSCCNKHLCNMLQTALLSLC